MTSRTRVLLVHNIMAPYRFPLFRALAEEPGIQLMVWFMSRSARNRRWAHDAAPDLGFNYDVLPGIEVNYFGQDLFTYILNYSFPWRYFAGPCDVLIAAGWLDFAAQTGFALSKVLRRKFVVWSESTPNEPSWRRTIAMPLVKTMVSNADACISVGTRSRQYLGTLGARESDIFTAYSTIDVDHFQRVSSAARLDREERKRLLGIRRSRVILYCGQFIVRKGLPTLIDAYARIKGQYEDVALVLVGYGPLQAELQRSIADQGLVDVHFIGHVEVSDMPRLYALGDIFVLPSHEETWGLVVNEAMACGLPVIVTNHVGSAPDLVAHGRNGYVIEVGDSGSLAALCAQLLGDDALLSRFSACSASRIREFTPGRAAEQFARAIEHATGRS
jgi:glycosyltransferase involved in cell wall biosynthesis